MQKSIKPIWWRASWFWSGWEQKEKWSRFSWLVWESQDYLFRIYLFAAILHLIRYIFVIVISVQSHVSSYFCTTSNWPKILCTSPNLKISRYWYQNQSFVYVKIFVNLKGVKINRFLTSKYSSNLIKFKINSLFKYLRESAYLNLFARIVRIFNHSIHGCLQYLYPEKSPWKPLGTGATPAPHFMWQSLARAPLDKSWET